MKIFIVGYEHPFKDKRTYRSAKLLSRDFDVYYQFMGESSGMMENVVNIPIEKRPGTKNPFKWLKKWKDFDNELFQKILQCDPDTVYFHYLPFTGSAIIKKLKEMGIKIVFEIHEIIPEQFMNKYKIFDFIRNNLWNEFIESIRISDCNICVSEDIMNYIFDRGSFKTDFLSLENYSILGFPVLPKLQREKEIVIVGKDPRYFNREDYVLESLKAKGFKIKKIGLDNLSKSYFDKSLPVLPYDEMMKELSVSAFSFISMSSNPKNFDFINDKFSMPNKFFDSVAAGTPVILNKKYVSMKSIMEKDNTGVILDFDNMEKSISDIIDFYDNFDERILSLKENQYKYYWSGEKEKEYTDFIKKSLEV